MDVLAFIYVTVSSLLVLVTCHDKRPLDGIVPQEGHLHEMNQGEPKVNIPRSHNILHDKKHVQDKDHILEHLDGVVEKKTEDMSEDELHFHYFKLHDYDQNNKLDGIELIAAMTHQQREDDPNSVTGMTDEELSNMIDTILEEDDKDRDGYIDYSEFVMSQNADL